MKAAPKSAASGRGHRLGGACAHPPACPECGKASQLVAELDLADHDLRGTGLARENFPVFWCVDCGDWGPTFHDLSKPRVAALDAKMRAVPAAKESRRESELALRPTTLVPLAAGRKAGRVTKVGGIAAWLQSPAVPECPRCHREMAFVLQVASDRCVSFDDEGLLYAFACPACRLSATLVQSH